MGGGGGGGGGCVQATCGIYLHPGDIGTFVCLDVWSYRNLWVLFHRPLHSSDIFFQLIQADDQRRSVEFLNEVSNSVWLLIGHFLATDLVPYEAQKT